MLLEKPIENTYLQMYGDLNQDVRSAKRKGKASWQSTGLDFRGRVKTLQKNYRNTMEINNYLEKMLSVIHRRMIELDLRISQKDLDLGSLIALRHGPLPKVINTTGTEVALKLIEMIKRLTSANNITLADVALIYPHPSHIRIN